MKCLFLNLLALSSLSLLVLAFGPDGFVPIRSWSPIKHVMEIGGFAVTEHNKKAGDSLVFGKVIKGEQQVVAGLNYRLVLEAKDGKGKMGTYKVVFWEKAWEGFRQLTTFNPV